MLLNDIEIKHVHGVLQAMTSTSVTVTVSPGFSVSNTIVIVPTSGTPSAGTFGAGNDVVSPGTNGT